MNVQGPEDIYEGDILDVVCEVVHRLNNIEVFLIKDREILKQARKSLRHQFQVQEGDSGELVCKAEWGNVQKESYKAITVRGRKPNHFLSPRLPRSITLPFASKRRGHFTCALLPLNPQSSSPSRG